MKLIAKPKHLKAARKKMGYRQADMADLISAFLEEPVSEATYNKWETGARKVELRMAKTIAGILQTPVHKVFTSGAAPIFKAG